MNEKWECSPEELENITAAAIKNRLRSHLNLAGITSMPGFFVCFLHGEFEPTSGKFILHMHGVTTTEKAAALDRLKEGNWGYVKTSTGAAPIRRMKVKDREKQFSYLLKSFWPMKAVRVVKGKKKRDRTGMRIIEPSTRNTCSGSIGRSCRTSQRSTIAGPHAIVGHLRCGGCTY